MSDDHLADALSQLGGQAPKPQSPPAATPSAQSPTTERPQRPDAPPQPRQAPAAASPRPAVPRPRPSVPAAKPAAPAPAPADDDELVDAEIDDVEDESGEAVASTPHPLSDLQQAAAPVSARIRPRKPQNSLKATAAPVLVTVGVLLLIPAVWATLLLTGAKVPMSDRDDAAFMAKIMLAAWPLGIILLTAGLVFIIQVSREKQYR